LVLSLNKYLYIHIFGSYYHFILIGWWQSNDILLPKQFPIFIGTNKIELKATMFWFPVCYLASVGSVQNCKPQHWHVILLFVFWLFVVVVVVTILTLSCVLVPWIGTVDVSDAECKTGHV
jgi:hypothetical protein